MDFCRVNFFRKIWENLLTPDFRRRIEEQFKGRSDVLKLFYYYYVSSVKKKSTKVVRGYFR